MCRRPGLGSGSGGSALRKIGGACSACGVDVDALSGWKCSRCRTTFCGEHRLPENHDCAPKAAQCEQCGSYVKAVWECDCKDVFCKEHVDPENHDCPIPASRYAPPLHMAHYRKRRPSSRAKPAATAGACVAVLILAVFLVFPAILPGPAGAPAPANEDGASGAAVPAEPEAGLEAPPIALTPSEPEPVSEGTPPRDEPEIEPLPEVLAKAAIEPTDPELPAWLSGLEDVTRAFDPATVDLGSLDADRRPDYSEVNLTATYYVDAVPPYYSEARVEAALEDAFSAWTSLNPGLDFRRVHGATAGHDLVITWQRVPITDTPLLPDAPYVVGLATRQYPGADEILIGLGTTDCSGEWHGMDGVSLASTLAHEMGHILGLEHHADESHLMYGSDPEAHFDDLGLQIPVLEEGHYGEYAEWESRYEELSAGYDGLDRQYAELDAELDVLDRALSEASGHEYNRIVSEYNQMVEDLNRLVDRMEPISAEIGDLADRMNCMYSLDSP